MKLKNMTPERLAKFSRVAAGRQPNLTVILENVHDAHNIGAVLRSCDSVGVHEIFVLYTEPHLSMDNIVLGKRSSGGALKWVDVNLYTDVEACFQHVRRKCDIVLGTHLGENAESVFQLDLTRSVALLFGNERDGLSAEARSHCDGNFVIPQVGMAESLNISVACAVTLYEAFRQRMEKGFYGPNFQISDSAQDGLLAEYIRRHEEKLTMKKSKRIK